MASRSKAQGISAGDFDTDDNGYPPLDAPPGTPLGRWAHDCSTTGTNMLVSEYTCRGCGDTRPPRADYGEVQKTAIAFVDNMIRAATMTDGILTAATNGRLPLGSRSKKRPILLMGQADAAQNGVWYVLDAGSQTRPYKLQRQAVGASPPRAEG